MANIIRVTELLDENDAGQNRVGQREYVRTFRVEFDGIGGGPGQAIAAINIQEWDPYFENSGYVDYASLAVSVNARRENDESYNFLVTYNYSTEPWDEIAKAIQSGGRGTTGHRPPSPGSPNQDPTSPQNPLARPAVITWGAIKERRVLERDFAPEHALALKNTAGDPYDPPLEYEQTQLTLTIERNEENFNALGASIFFDTVNDHEFFGFAKETVKCESITAVSQYENGFSFWAVTYQFHYRPEGWKIKVIQRGTNRLIGTGADTKKVRIVDDRSVPVTEPVFLDVFGEPLAKDKDPITLDYTAYPPYDFDGLALP